MNKQLVRALECVSKLEGVQPIVKGTYDKEGDIVIRGRNVDCYLLVATLATRLKAGDIEIKEIGDKAGKKDYFNKLINSISKLED